MNMFQPICFKEPSSSSSYIDGGPEPNSEYSFYRPDNNTCLTELSTRPATELNNAAYAVYICPGCNEPFDSISKHNHYIGKVPLVLHCFHTVCQECIIKGLVKDKINCPICHKDSSVLRQGLKDNLQEVFRPHFYLLGIIMYFTPQTKSNLESLNLVATQIPKKDFFGSETAVDSETFERCCFVSCEKEAVLHCTDCNDKYCLNCCTVVHNSAKNLMLHKQVPINRTNFSLDLEKCSDHNMLIEFFCKSCRSFACVYCMLKHHPGHDSESVSELDTLEREECHKLTESSKKILRQLVTTQKKVRSFSNYNTHSMEKRICRYFTNLHAKIQSAERRLRTELINLKVDDKKLGNINLSLTSSMELLKNLVSAADSVDSGNKLNLKRLLGKLREVQNTPCYLLSENCSSEPVEFVVNQVIENIDDWFSLQSSEDFDFFLVPENQLPEDYVSDPPHSLLESDDETNSTTLPEHNKIEDLTLKPSSSYTRVPEMQLSEVIRSTLNTSTDVEKVIVTHTSSMESFYVQKKRMLPKLSNLSKELHNYVKMDGPSVSQPQINGLYLTMYLTKHEQQWCRGRVTEIKNGEKEPLYEMFFIDYGYSQTVNANRLRELTPYQAKQKPFAIECRLQNPTGIVWSDNAHITFAKIINGKELYMMTKSINNNVHEIDLMISSSDGGITSVLDILIHSSKKCLITVRSSSETPPVKESFRPNLKILANSKKFYKNQWENVVLANVVDPDRIFVHMVSQRESFKKLNSAMRKAYKNSFEACVPIEGSYVAVERKDLNRALWHRALVKKVELAAGKAHLLLVDWGINVIAPISNIRMLQESFTELETQAIVVKLVHVAPYDKQSSWSDSATQFLMDYFRSKETFKMMVHSTEPQLEVAIYQTLDTGDICLNAKLVENCLAHSTGPISIGVESVKYNTEDGAYTEEVELMSSLLKKVGDESESASEEEDFPNVVRREVNIVKAESPGTIFVKFPANQERESMLFKDLQIHYSEVQETKLAWKPDEMCVVAFANEYMRGKIVDRVGECYKVYMPDKVEEDIVPLNRIYVYDKYFVKYPQVSYRCHLANIKPPSDTGKWSYSAIEALQKIFEKHEKFYLTKVEELVPDESKRDAKSMPIHLWYRKMTLGGALEPNRILYKSINNALVKLGFAYRQSKYAEEHRVPKNGDTEQPIPAKLEEIVSSRGKELSNKEYSESEDQNSSEKELNMSKSNSENKNKSVTDKYKSGEEDNNELSNDGSSIEEKAMKKSINRNKLLESDDMGLERGKIAKCKSEDASLPTEVAISDWLPPYRLIERDFPAIVTCAENGGYLFLHEERLEPVYRKMEENMKEYFDNNPPKREHHRWEPGDICTIHYEEYWYRGRIIKVKSPTQITVFMIDYGSDHDVSPDVLYREILYPHVEAFATKVKLYQLFAKSGAWMSSDYDALMEIITENCRIVVQGPLDVDVPYVDVYKDSGVLINQMLTELCPNLTRCVNSMVDSYEGSDESAAIIMDEEFLPAQMCLDFYQTFEIGSIEVITNSYKEQPFPCSEGNKMLLSIMSFLEYNKVVLKDPRENSCTEIYLVMQDIQESLDMMPVLEHIELGFPCIAPYSVDNVWYRAKIQDILELEYGYVRVLFVDYGNTEVVSVNDLKMMKEEWFEIPVSCYIADVNIELTLENHAKHVLQQMNNLCGKNRRVEVVREDPVMVHLYEKNGQLCYQRMIDLDLLKKVIE